MMSAFKSFLKNSGVEEEVRENAGIGIIDILSIVEVVIGAFKT